MGVKQLLGEGSDDCAEGTACSGGSWPLTLALGLKPPCLGECNKLGARADGGGGGGEGRVRATKWERSSKWEDGKVLKHKPQPL